MPRCDVSLVRLSLKGFIKGIFEPCELKGSLAAKTAASKAQPLQGDSKPDGPDAPEPVQPLRFRPLVVPA